MPFSLLPFVLLLFSFDAHVLIPAPSRIFYDQFHSWNRYDTEKNILSCNSDKFGRVLCHKRDKNSLRELSRHTSNKPVKRRVLLVEMKSKWKEKEWLLPFLLSEA